MSHWRATFLLRSRPRRTVILLAALLVLFRSAVFVFWPQSYFDSDQAIHGLMAKHIAEGRAFPVFMYGQSYFLAVEAWLAAPLFLIAGASVAALKLPMLLFNIAIAVLLVRLFVDEVGLPPAYALVATLCFALAAPGTAAQLVAASGGMVEPFLYVVLLWLTRDRPNWGGLILGVGFLNREFTIYGLASLLTLDAVHGTLFTRAGLIRRARMFRTAAEVWLVVTWLKQYSSAAGPGTTLADLYQPPPDNVRELLNHICIDPHTMLPAIWQGMTDHLPRLFGVVRQPLTEYGIESGAGQGFSGGAIILAAAGIIAAVRIAMRLARDRQWRREYDPCVYLLLTGLFSFGAFTTLRCGVIGTMRYELLSLLGATGLAAWYLRTEANRVVAAVWIALMLSSAAFNGVAHARLWTEYLTHPPVGAKRLIIRHLESRGIRYAYSDYWLAYYISFMTREKIIVASTDVVRIQEYRRIVDAHRNEAVRISRTPCPEGHEIMRRVYLCSP